MLIDVIGGSGFIGTRLVRRLKNNEHSQVKIIDKAPSKSFPDLTTLGDVRSIDELRTSISQNSVIVNLAAEHRDDVRPLSLYDDVNVGGAKNICTVAREKGVETIVFTSTVAVYGFAPADTDENGVFAPFNDYGRTKLEAEYVYKEWQSEDPENRSLVIVRPTVTFGEQNRGNVYNLLRQIADGRFIMVGNGINVKSMAYVENLAAFIEYALTFGPGLHIYNYIDKPDFDMNTLVANVRKRLGKGDGVGLRVPYLMGLFAGYIFDLATRLTGRTFPISSIRVKKFCGTTQFATSVAKSGFVAPVTLEEGLERTVRHEFLENHGDEQVFFTE